MLRRQRHRSITFKQAVYVVLGLHVIGYVSFCQWSAYKAKQARQVKRAQILAKVHKPEEWNNKNKELKIVAVSQPALKQLKALDAELSKEINNAAKVAVKEVNKSTNVIKKEVSAFVEQQNKPIRSEPKKPINAPREVVTRTVPPPVQNQIKTLPIESSKRTANVTTFGNDGWGRQRSFDEFTEEVVRTFYSY